MRKGFKHVENLLAFCRGTGDISRVCACLGQSVQQPKQLQTFHAKFTPARDWNTWYKETSFIGILGCVWTFCNYPSNGPCMHVRVVTGFKAYRSIFGNRISFSGLKGYTYTLKLDSCEPLWRSTSRTRRIASVRRLFSNFLLEVLGSGLGTPGLQKVAVPFRTKWYKGWHPLASSRVAVPG